MSIYLYQLGSGGNWVLGARESVPVSSYSMKAVKTLVSGVWNIEIKNSINDSTFVSARPLSQYVKEDGTPYRSIEEFERLTLDLFSELGVSTGGITITNVTYAELMLMIGTSTLVSGNKYRITDYKTVHYITYNWGTQVLDTIIEGTLEPLTVTATSTNTLDSVAISELHPKDLILYDPDPANWLLDASFADQTVIEAPVIIAGFKGVIYSRHDQALNVKMGFDFRNTKSRRWKCSAPAWDIDTTYAMGDIVEYNGWFNVCLAASTGNQPNESPTFWTGAGQLINRYFAPNDDSASYLGYTVDLLDFQDLLTFQMTYDDTNYKNINISPLLDNMNTGNWNKTILLNNVFYMAARHVNCQFGMSNNTCLHNFQSVTSLAENVTDNLFTSSVYFLTCVGTFYGNHICGQEFAATFVANAFNSNKIFSYNCLESNIHYMIGCTVTQSLKNLQGRFDSVTISGISQAELEGIEGILCLGGAYKYRTIDANGAIVVADF